MTRRLVTGALVGALAAVFSAGAAAQANPTNSGYLLDTQTPPDTNIWRSGNYADPKNSEVGDTQVAAQVDGIDFIASGHTHTFMTEPVVVKQPQGANTFIFQVGRSGIYVGRVDMKLRDGKVTAAAGRLLDLRDQSLA